jgi:hypothetical protein
MTILRLIQQDLNVWCRDMWPVLSLGYRNDIGILQRYRVEQPRRIELVSMSSFLLDYLFADLLFPAALDVLKQLCNLGLTAILSDGDVVIQPREVEHARLAEVVDERMLIYIHKKQALDDVDRCYPAEHYVLVDDKLRILNAVKQFWRECVTTVFARQGSYAHDPKTDKRVLAGRCDDRAHRGLARLLPATAANAAATVHI